MTPSGPAEPEWGHLAYQMPSAVREVYGYAGRQGSVNLEGIRFRPPGPPSRTLLIYMHPASTLQLLPVPRAMAGAGVDVLCAGSRYARNDTPLIMEMAPLALYDPRNPNQPPYTPEFLPRFRAAQLERVRRRSAYVRKLLEQVRAEDGPAAERGLLTHRTLADPRFLDPTIDPNDRPAGAGLP